MENMKNHLALVQHIVEKLELNERERIALFHLASNTDRNSVERTANAEGSLEVDEIKLSYVLGILIAVWILMSDPARAKRHLRLPNASPPFSGRSAMDLMLSGKEGLRLTRQYYDAQAQPLGRDDPAYQWAIQSILS
ncbi:antitoxin Xre/MbcA/ParS toxin-binding domain-containing protein [Marinobacter salicampi]|uniref:antitoxin Xre/MbcA/ParS toxin-binding domain-containing protein n=1 Tax=Marinobacter salicampi TaxID=435907 RepID=UPI00140C693F|nr:antitoxin Xre/MbcA/ParS toxin-binding domain-containing protein [Marinobacter salicampi]